MINNLKFSFSLIWRLIILGFFIVYPQLSWAKYSFPMKDGDCEAPHFAIKEEYIYFQPFFDNDFIAAPNINGQMSFTLQPGGPGKKNKFNYTSGYRLSALYSNPHSLIKNGGLRFTYLPAHHFRRISLDAFLSALAASPASDESNLDPLKIKGFLSSDHHLNYYAGDLFAIFPIFDTCYLSFSAHPGLHYAFMSYQSHVHFSTNNSKTLKEKSETWGLGPQLGLKVNYQFFDGFAIEGGIKGGLLLSKARAHFKMKPFNIAENLNDSSHSLNPKALWKTFPFWETNIGLCASLSIYGYTLEIEIGYEYLTYPNFIDRIQFPSNGSLNADNIFSNFDFQGPYASILIVF